MNLSSYMQKAIVAGNVSAVKRFLWLHRGHPESLNVRVPISRRFLLAFGGDTALTLAIKNEQTEVVRALLASSEIDVNKSDAYGFTPLMMAIQFGCKEIAKLLLSRKDIQLEVELPSHGNTAYFFAVKYQAQEIKAELLARGANPDHRNQKGHTAEQAASIQVVAMNEPLGICFR